MSDESVIPKIELPEREIWDIGHYCGDRSICVNVTFRGKQFHRSDYGLSPLSRFIRLGLAIESLEKESGLLAFREELKAMAERIAPSSMASKCIK